MISTEFNDLKSITDPIEQSQILGTLYTRIAGGLENKEQQPADVGMVGTGDAWNKANEHIIKIAKENPHDGMELALALINLPQSSNVQHERVNSWMRTSGLMLLGLDEMKQELVNFLSSNSDAIKLTDTIMSYMNTDVSELTTPDKYDGNPKGYTAVQSVYIGLGLKEVKNNNLTRVLYEHASKRMSETDLKMAYGIVSSFSDCVYLKSRI